MKYLVWDTTFTGEESAQEVEANSVDEAVENFVDDLFDDFKDTFIRELDEDVFHVYVKGLLGSVIERKITYKINFIVKE